MQLHSQQGCPHQQISTCHQNMNHQLAPLPQHSRAAAPRLLRNERHDRHPQPVEDGRSAVHDHHAQPLRVVVLSRGPRQEPSRGCCGRRVTSTSGLQARLGAGCRTHHCTRCGACRCEAVRRQGAARKRPRPGAAQTCSTANTPRSAPASRFSSRISARVRVIAGGWVYVSLHGGARAGRAVTPQVEDAHGLAVGVLLLVQELDCGLEAVHYQPAGAAGTYGTGRQRWGRSRAVTAAARPRHLFVSAAPCFMCLLTTTTVTGRPRLSLPCRKAFFWSSSVRISSCAGVQRPRSPSQARSAAARPAAARRVGAPPARGRAADSQLAT